MNIAIKDVLVLLEELAPLYIQESYDNAGLITGEKDSICSGIICCLDATEAVIVEAIEKNCNLVVAHHPILFKPLKKFTGGSYVEKALLTAIKHDIAIYAIHTNLDNTLMGVNKAIATKLGLIESSLSILSPIPGQLSKLYTYVPAEHADNIREALFKAGAGVIGQYHECSFALQGKGTFRPMPGTTPFTGNAGGDRETVEEVKIEFLFPSALQQKVLTALLRAHPYEEVAYEIIVLANSSRDAGAGLVGELAEPINERELLNHLKKQFNLKVVKHTHLLNKPIKRMAVCGGAGSFLTRQAIAAGAGVFITSDIKYHEFFDAESKILLADIGHYESEQYTIDLLTNFLQDKIPTFAVLKTEVNTNPVNYFV